MFSHSTRDLTAIRFHLLDALILALLAVTVCPIVHSPSTFAPCYSLRPVQRSSFYSAGAQRGDPQYASVLRRTGSTPMIAYTAFWLNPDGALGQTIFSVHNGTDTNLRCA